MKKTPNNDDKKAKLIIAEVDSLFHTAEKYPNNNGTVTYLDIIRICDRVRSHFDDKVPNRIEGPLKVASGVCNPNKLDLINSISKGLGVILAGGGGGTALVIGIVTIMVYGLSAATATGFFWWKTSVVSIIWGGPIGIALGIAGIATGIYVMSKQASPKKRATVARDIIIKGVSEWGEFGRINDFPEIKWIKKLSDNEFTALMSLLWYIMGANQSVGENATRLIEHVLKSKKIKSSKFLLAGNQLDIDTSLNVICKSKHKKECALLLKEVMQADNMPTQEDDVVWIDIVKKLNL